MPRCLIELDSLLTIRSIRSEGGFAAGNALRAQAGTPLADPTAGFNAAELAPLARYVLETGSPQHIPALPAWAALAEDSAAAGGDTCREIDLVIEPLQTRGKIEGVRLIISESAPSTAAYNAALARNDLLVMQHEVDRFLLENQFNQALQRICRYAVARFRADYAVIALLENDILIPREAAGFPIPLQEMPVIHLNQGIIGYVATIGKPYRTLDPRNDPHYMNLPTEKVYAADMAAPIYEGGEPGKGSLLGVISLETANPAGFLGDALEQLAALTTDIARVLMQDRARRAGEKHLRDLTILRELALNLTEAPDLPAIARLGVDAARKLLDSTAAFLFTYNPDLDLPPEEHPNPNRPPALKLEASNVAESLAGMDFSKPRQGGITYAVARSGKPIVVNDPAQSPFYTPDVVQKWRMHSIVGVPLVRQGRVMGVLTASYSFPRPIEEASVHILTLLVEQLASHIESARLRSAAAQRFIEMETLYRISSNLRQTRSRSEVEQMLVDEVMNIFLGDATMIYSPLPDGQRLAVTSAAGRGVATLGTEIPINASIAGRIFMTAKPLRSADLLNEPNLYRSLVSKQELGGALITAMYVPLQVGVHVYAVLQVQKRYTAQPFSESDLRLLETIAQVGGTALQQAVLYEETNRRAEQIQRTADRLARFIRATEALAQTTDFSEMMRVALDFAFEMAGAERGAIFLLQEDRLLPIHTRGLSAEAEARLQAARITTQAGLFKDVLDTGLPVEIADTQMEINRIEWLPGYTGSQIYCAPLMVDQHVIALVDLDRLPPGDEARSLLGAFLDRAAGAIHRARLYQEIQQVNQALEARVSARTAELKAERDRINAILEAAGEGIVVTDTRGRVVYINPAMERQTGFTLQEVQGRLMGLWQVSAQSRSNLKKMWRQVNRGETWQGEMQAIHKNGKSYDVALTVSPLRGVDGQISGFVGVQQDITQLKDLDRMKSQFVSNVSHELRTPITNLNLYLEMLPKATPERSERYLATLARETERLATLVEDILAISRLDLGKTKPELRPVNLPALLEELVEDRRPLAVKRGLDLEFYPASSPVWVQGDVKFITQVATNLLTNALNYTPPGGRVEIQAFYQVEPSGGVFSVADTGPGIAPEERVHIFERFYRGAAGVNSRQPGTGLGLAMVQDMVNLMNGKITLDTQVGKGTRFTIWLPKANGPA